MGESNAAAGPPNAAASLAGPVGSSDGAEAAGKLHASASTTVLGPISDGVRAVAASREGVAAGFENANKGRTAQVREQERVSLCGHPCAVDAGGGMQEHIERKLLFSGEVSYRFG